MLKLNNGFVVDADGDSYVLKKLAQKSEDKNKKDDVRGYYSKLSAALTAYSEKCLSEYVQEKNVSLSEVRDKIEELKQEIGAYEL